jgi:hypothetical protein
VDLNTITEFAPATDVTWRAPMSEAPFNPVAPALANAIRDATGVRFASLPLRRDVAYGGLNKSCS